MGEIAHRAMAGHESRFLFYLTHDEEVAEALGADKLAEMFEGQSTAFHTKHADTIFERVFGKA